MIKGKDTGENMNGLIQTIMAINQFKLVIENNCINRMLINMSVNSSNAHNPFKIAAFYE